MALSGDLETDHDCGTQYKERKVVNNLLETHRQWPRWTISEPIMITAPLPGSLGTYGAPATREFIFNRFRIYECLRLGWGLFKAVP